MGDKKRIGFYDIAKGIGLFLVVYAHSRAPYMQYIYMFHMPFFFIISGLLYSDRAKMWDYTVKKIKSLYIPFAFWNVVFTLLFMAITNQWRIIWFVKRVILILSTIEKEKYIGRATWFLGALFGIAVLYRIFDYMTSKIKHNEILILIISIGFAVLGFSITLPHLMSRTLILSMFYAIGVVVRRNKVKNEKVVKWAEKLNIPAAIITFGLFVLLGKGNYVKMGINDYSNPFTFCIGAVLASYAIIALSKAIDKVGYKWFEWFKKLLMFFGKNSIDIVIWQFFSFGFVIAIQMAISGEPVTLNSILVSLPVYSNEGCWWIIYTVVGMVVPILIGRILRIGPWGKLFKKVYMV